jgi:dipeptidyl aminopeptidase/acylaminoacyl peptidase
MKNGRFCVSFLVFSCLSSFEPLSTEAAGTSDQAKRPVTVADSIGMNLLADESYYNGYSPADPVAQYSPDGSKFIVVLRRGNLERDTNDCSLLLWWTKTASESPIPEKLLTIASSSNRQAIEQIHWLDDNETLTFLGEHPGEHRQLYAFNIRTRAMQKLTNHPANLLAYDITSDGRTIAYTADEPLESIFDARTTREGVSVDTEWLPDLVDGTKGGGDWLNPQLFVQTKGNPPIMMKISGGVPNPLPYLSPDGKYIVIATRVAEVPVNWSAYSDSEIKWLVKAPQPRGQYSWLSRYALIDIETGKQSILMDSPASRHLVSHVAWLPDSRSVAVQGVYLPLDNTEDEERKSRETNLFSVEVKVPSGEMVKISSEDLRLVGWDSRGNRLVFDVGSDPMPTPDAPKAYFRRNGSGWERTTEGVPESRPTIVLDEEINVAPKISMITPTTGRKRLLLDLNPQFSDLDFARVEEVHWKDSEGENVSGGLYFPIGYDPGKRYPLVIQTHGWNPHRFWIDGAYTSGYAAQALAGNGIMVLQAGSNYDGTNTFASVKREVGTLENAIKYLDARSLIDPKRVGLVGFSITGIYVKYALTHSPYQFAAASVADDNDLGYFQYIVDGNHDGARERMYESINGGSPFGEGLKSWMERTPAFNAQKVQAPVRIVVHRRASLLWEWEWFVALRLLHKPVEMIYMQDGAHILVKPWERMISQQGNVDWFVFWLKGEEDPDPLKAEEYSRWRELRKKQQENHAKDEASKEQSAATVN